MIKHIFVITASLLFPSGLSAHPTYLVEGEIPTYLYADNAVAGVLIQFGANAEGSSDPRFNAITTHIKAEIAKTKIRLSRFYLIESKNEIFFKALNDQMDKDRVNFVIKVIVKDFPKDPKLFTKAKNFKSVSMYIEQRLRMITFSGMEYGTYHLDNIENLDKLLARFDKDLRNHEPEYFDKTMYIPKTINTVDTKAKTYSDFPPDLKKSKLLYIKLDPYDNPDWKSINEVHSKLLREKLKIPYEEVRKNQVDEYEAKGYHYLIEHFHEIVFSNEKDAKSSKSKQGLTTKYYYYLRDIDDDHKYSVKDEGHDSLTTALNYLLDTINQEIK